MEAERPILDGIASTYAAQARWMSKAAGVVFEVTERVLMVGAAKYAAAALPKESPSKDTLVAVSEFLHVVLLYWLVTKLWAQSSADYKTLHHALIFRSQWVRWVYRGCTLALVVGSVWWFNHIIHDLIEQTVGAFARPEGH